MGFASPIGSCLRMLQRGSCRDLRPNNHKEVDPQFHQGPPVLLIQTGGKKNLTVSQEKGRKKVEFENSPVWYTL